MTPCTNCKDLVRLCPWPGPFLSPLRRRSASFSPRLFFPWRRPASFSLVSSSRGAGLLKPCRPAPLYALYGRFPAQVCELSADSRQKPCRPAPGMSQACAKNLADRRQQCHRPAPKTVQTGASNVTGLRQEPCRPAPGMSQACAKNLADRRQKLPDLSPSPREGRWRESPVGR